MKNKKLCGIIAGMAMLANLGVVAVGSASTTTSDQQITGGSLAINSVPSSTNFSSLAVSVSNQTTSIVNLTSAVDFQDTRGDGAAAFTLSVSDTDLQSATQADSFDLTNLEMSTDSDDTLTAVGSSDCTTGITLNQLTLSTFANSNGEGTGTDDVSDAKNLVTGSSLERVMNCTAIPEIRLTVPAKTPVATYRTTLTFSIA